MKPPRSLKISDRKLVVPPNLTYHERKTYEDIPEDALLVYDLILVELREKWDPEMECRLPKSDTSPDQTA